MMTENAISDNTIAAESVPLETQLRRLEAAVTARGKLLAALYESERELIGKIRAARAALVMVENQCAELRRSIPAK